MNVAERIRQKLAELPHKPGVYIMRDRFGRVIYVGKARDLRRRVTQYFQRSRQIRLDPKLRALVEAISDFDVYVVRSEAEAILLEGKLIKEYKPRYNVSFRDDKRFLMIKVNLNDPIPRFQLTRVKLDDGAMYFGPFPSASAVRRTLTLIRQRFKLRGCKAFTPTERDYKHCLYAHLKSCSAPCIGNVSSEQYKMQVQAACDFLTGHCEEMAKELEEQMRKAAAELDFERAAQLRDLLNDLKITLARIERFERLPYSLPPVIDPEKDLAELAQLLGLRSLPLYIEAFDISNISSSFKVASMVCFWKGRPERSNYRRYRIKTVEGQDDYACISEVVRRRYSRLIREIYSIMVPKDQDSGEPSPVELQKYINEVSKAIKESRKISLPPLPSERKRFPDLILIDGGKGQLNAALKALKELALDFIPVIGLAKEFEGIYKPGEKDPIILPPDSRALKLLQRIRDESHRFAHSYNAELRLQRMRESILDEFPGIGEQRKKALLQTFGSIHRIRNASVEEIAKVPGFGPVLAQKLKEFLMNRIGRSKTVS